MENRKNTPLTSLQIAEALSRPTISPGVLHKLGILPLGRAGIYDACKNGDLQTVRYRRKIAIVTAPLRKKLGMEAA